MNYTYIKMNKEKYLTNFQKHNKNVKNIISKFHFELLKQQSKYSQHT